MIDLCMGPHIPHTGKIKAFMVTKVRSWLQNLHSVLTGGITELCIVFPWRRQQRFIAANLRYLIPRQEAVVGVQGVPR